MPELLCSATTIFPSRNTQRSNRSEVSDLPPTKGLFEFEICNMREQIEAGGQARRQCGWSGGKLLVAQRNSTHKCLYFFIFNNIKNSRLQSRKMGSVESKIKNGYSLNQKPLLGPKTQEGVRPNKNSTFTKSPPAALDLDQTNSSEHDQSDNVGPGNTKEKKPQAPTSQAVTGFSQYPYSSIGLVTCFLNDQKIIGSGCLIGPNYVLTCAHNLWSFKDRKMGKNIAFTPIFNPSAEVPSFQAKKIHLSQELLTSDAAADDAILLDYAVIELQCANIQQDIGTLALNFDFKLNPDEPLSILGYSRQGRDFTLYQLSGEAVEEEGLLKYDMSALYGMSGAPIINSVEGVTEIVGIHVFCRHRNGRVERGGIKLNGHMMKNLTEWCVREEEEIDLREKGMGKEGLKHLSKHKWSNLVSLNLSRNGFENNTAKYLKRGHWKNLVNFDLGGNRICKEGAQALAQSEMKAIVTLNLWGNFIGKGGAYCISMAGWENLTNLNLYNNEIGDEGVEYLTHANWKRLNNLNLGKNAITFNGAQHILEGKWPNLASLNLWGNQLAGEETLLKARLLEHFRLLKFLYF